tara:strand:- start:404 stop:802 length:399 start_codon:yes stop_codon:yes gene_type:complete
MASKELINPYMYYEEIFYDKTSEYYDKVSDYNSYGYEIYLVNLISFLKDYTEAIPQMEFAYTRPLYDNCEKVYIVVKNSKCDEMVLLLLVFVTFIFLLTQCCKKKHNNPTSIVHVEPLKIKQDITEAKLSVV